LDLAKVEAGRMELIIEDVDLADLCVETVQQLEGQAKTKDGAVKLVTEVPPEVESISTDSAKLKQVIINLIGNALKFTEQGSVTVRLETAADGRTPIAIAVVDTGIGIPEDRLEAIFQAFQQAEAGTSRKYGGTGLGLALSRSICLLMGYDLLVESKLGEGSTFRIVLGERAGKPKREADPVDGATAKDFAAAEKARRSQSGTRSDVLSQFRVLVIDDERDSRVLAQHYLEEFGCDVVTAVSGEEGLVFARAHRPDLITLDLLMPGMNGWEVLNQLKADPDLRGIPVVVISVVAGEGSRPVAGAVDLITKPFEREDLLRVIWRHLVRKSNGRVLVVADAGEARDRIVGFLEERGLEVFPAADAIDAWEGIRLQVPDAMLVDATVPAIEAVKLLERIRSDRAHQGLPVVAWVDASAPVSARIRVEELATLVVPAPPAPDGLGDALRRIFPTLESEPIER
jgi:CheY-like chemotaxis protein